MRTMQKNFGYVLHARHCEPISKLPSLTVPDMSYSIKELLEKFTQGIDPGVTRAAQWDDDEDLDHDSPDLQELANMDIADKMMYKSQLSNELEGLKHDLTRKVARKQAKKGEPLPADSSDSTNEDSSASEA